MGLIKLSFNFKIAHISEDLVLIDQISKVLGQRNLQSSCQIADVLDESWKR